MANQQVLAQALPEETRLAKAEVTIVLAEEILTFPPSLAKIFFLNLPAEEVAFKEDSAEDIADQPKAQILTIR